MAWFHDVPDQIKVGRYSFLAAGQAVEMWQARLLGPNVLDKIGERPSPDWPAVSVFLLARLQSEQLISILMSEFDIEARLFSGSEVS